MPLAVPFSCTLVDTVTVVTVRTLGPMHFYAMAVRLPILVKMVAHISSGLREASGTLRICVMLSPYSALSAFVAVGRVS